MDATNWNNFTQAGGVPDNLFYKKDGYGHPPPPQKYSWVKWADMAKRGFYTPISRFDTHPTGPLSKVAWKKGAAGEFTTNPAKDYISKKAMPLWVIPFFSATRKQMGKVSSKDIVQMD